MLSPRKPGLAAACAVAALVGTGVLGFGFGCAPARAADELRCVFEVTRETVAAPLVGGPGVPPGARPRGMPKEKENFRLTVGLARDTLVCEDPLVAPEVVAYHFPLRRVTELDLQHRTYRDISLFAVLAFRVNESINRISFAASLARLPGAPGPGKSPGKGAGAPGAPPARPAADMPPDPDPDPAPPDPNVIRCVGRFAVESLYSIRLKGAPQAPPGATFLDRPVIREKPLTGPDGKPRGWQFLHDDEPAVEFEPSEHAVPPDYRRSLSHFLSYRCSIHPEIRDRILDSGRLPGRLKYHSVEIFGRIDQTVTLQLASAVVGPEQWQGPPAGFTPAFDPENPLDVVLRKVSPPAPAGTVGAAPAAPRVEAEELPADHAALGQFIDPAGTAGRPLDAYLGWLEYAARTGDPAPEFEPTVTAAAGAHRKAFQPHPAPTRAEAEQQARDLEAIDRKGLTRGYMIDARIGTILAALGRAPDAEDHWIKALDANPRLVQVYLHLGGARFRTFQMNDAWRCFDAARRAEPGSPQLADINGLEARFAADFPDEF